MAVTAEDFVLISTPKKTREDPFVTLKKKTDEVSQAFLFAVPDLKVGTLDSLMSLSDELSKVSAYVESVTRKVAQQREEAWEEGDAGGAGGAATLTVSGRTMQNYLTMFKWDDAKYSTSHPLKALVALIHSQVGKLDEELKVKASDYQQVMHSIAASERGRQGNLLQRDLASIVKPEHITQTEFLTTLFVAVPSAQDKNFHAEYEKLTEFVLPRSAKVVASDSEYTLYSVQIFKVRAEEFANLGRERKFFVREFDVEAFAAEQDAIASAAADGKAAPDSAKTLEAEKERQKNNLMRFCNVNFSEAFVAWTHLLAIRVFVESVLRYGLPTNFQAVLLAPRKGKEKRLRSALDELYCHLGGAANIFAASAADDEAAAAADEGFYPYVSLDVCVDMSSRTGF